jgi:methylenetetrahydrofolate reductase (NADPH)
MDADIRNLKAKVEAGAEYIVTQMFLDNQHYFNFVERCRNEGITVPIVPGLKPVSVKSHLSILPNTFHVDIPETLAREVAAAKDNKGVRQIGIDWAIAQAKELKAANVPSIHFYTMGKADNIYQIVKQVY